MGWQNPSKYLALMKEFKPWRVFTRSFFGRGTRHLPLASRVTLVISDRYMRNSCV